MIYYHRIHVSEGIDVNKTSESKECDIYHYWYFLNKGFKFQPNVCDIAILEIKGSDYRCIISRISKSEATKLLQNIELTEKSGTL